MSVLKALFRDQTWVAHLLGLSTITATQLASGNAVVSGIVAGLTAVFHVCQTFGNGTALPPGYTSTPAIKPSTTLNPSAPFGTPKVDAPAPAVDPIYNAAGTLPLDP